MIKLADYEELKRKSGSNWPRIKQYHTHTLEYLLCRINTLYNRMPVLDFRKRYQMERRNKILNLHHRIARLLDNN